MRQAEAGRAAHIVSAGHGGGAGVKARVRRDGATIDVRAPSCKAGALPAGGACACQTSSAVLHRGSTQHTPQVKLVLASVESSSTQVELKAPSTKQGLSGLAQPSTSTVLTVKVYSAGAVVVITVVPSVTPEQKVNSSRSDTGSEGRASTPGPEALMGPTLRMQ